MLGNFDNLSILCYFITQKLINFEILAKVLTGKFVTPV